MFIKVTYFIATLFFINAAAFLISQIPPLYKSLPMLICAVSIIAIPTALFWRDILKTNDAKDKIYR